MLAVQKIFYCIECNRLFWTPREIFEHTKNNYLVPLLLNNGNIQEDKQDDDIQIVKVIHTTPENKFLNSNGYRKNNSVLKETYYYFYIDCEEERGDNK